MRVKYESSANLVAEADVATRFAARYGLVAVKRAAMDHFDYDMMLPSGELLAVVEIKCRSDRFLGMIESGGYMISANRYNNQLRAELLKGGRVVLLVGIGGDIHFLSIGRTLPLRSVVGGRTRQTRDEYDVEEVVYIPWDWFTNLGDT